MKALEFLKQYEYADRKVRRLEREYEEQRIMIDSIKSTSDNDGMPHGTSISRPTEDRAIKLADKLHELVDARIDAIAARQKVFDFIQDIPGVEGDVLYRRYILLQKWESIESEMAYSNGGIYKIKLRALNIVDEKLGNE